MLLGERNFDFIRMGRREKVVIGHRASTSNVTRTTWSGAGTKRANLYHISRIPATRVVRAMPEAFSAPLGTKVCDLIDLSDENNDVTKWPS